MRVFIGTAAFCAFFNAGSAFAQSSAPKLDCGEPFGSTTLGRSACADAEVGNLFIKLNMAYRSAQTSTDDAGRLKLQADNQTWVRLADTKCGDATNTDCVKGLVIARLRQLGVAPEPASKAAAATTAGQAMSVQECSAKYQAAKAAGTLNGQLWNDFRLAQCGASSNNTRPANTASAPSNDGVTYSPEYIPGTFACVGCQGQDRTYFVTTHFRVQENGVTGSIVCGSSDGKKDVIDITIDDIPVAQRILIDGDATNKLLDKVRSSSYQECQRNFKLGVMRLPNRQSVPVVVIPSNFAAGARFGQYIGLQAYANGLSSPWVITSNPAKQTYENQQAQARAQQAAQVAAAQAEQARRQQIAALPTGSIGERIVAEYSRRNNNPYRFLGSSTNGPNLHIEFANQAGQTNDYGINCLKLDQGGYSCELGPYGRAIIQ